jgi:methionine-rich copper-binding protein CopC
MKMKIHQNMDKFCLTLFIILGIATHIHAHTGLRESTPAADSRVQAVPSQIELIFTGPVRLIRLDVVGDSEPQVTFSPASEPESVYRIPAAGLVNGEYEVAWAAIGADGHTIADSFRFVVDLSAASSAP